MEPSRRQFIGSAAAASIAVAAPYTLGAMMQTTTAATPATGTLRLGPAGSQKISRHIYGHFAEHLGRCIYDGIWVGPDSKIPNINGFRKDVVDSLKALNIPNLRWPGGCFADTYRWRDGIGPREQRPRTVNIHWGNYVEDNSFGTHEFLDLCELLECDAYVAVNVGSGTPAEMADWIEYMTFDGDSTLSRERRKNGREKPWRVPFVGVGNENWGCGGDMTPEFYVNLYNQFAVYARDFGRNRLTKVAGGPNVADHHWAQTLLEKGRGLRAMSWHCYAHYPSWDVKGPALADDADHWFGILNAANRVDEILTTARGYFEEKDPRNRVGIYFDEWGTWHRTEPGDTALYQQNTIRDALVASLTLDIFNRHADRVRMANIAQTVNVLQAVILTETPGGQDRMVLTPTYHVFEMYKPHMDGIQLPVELADVPDYVGKDKTLKQVSASASMNEQSRALTLSLSNLHHEQPIDLTIDLPAGDAGGAGRIEQARILTADTLNAHNTFDHPDAVKPMAFDGAKVANGKLTLQLPPRSVVTLTIG